MNNNLESNRVELRCPVGPDPGRLLGKVRERGERLYINESNLMELQCDWCADLYKRQGKPGLRVLHCYNFIGEFVETLIESK